MLDIKSIIKAIELSIKLIEVDDKNFNSSKLSLIFGDKNKHLSCKTESHCDYVCFDNISSTNDEETVVMLMMFMIKMLNFTHKSRYIDGQKDVRYTVTKSLHKLLGIDNLNKEE